MIGNYLIVKLILLLCAVVFGIWIARTIRNRKQGGVFSLIIYGYYFIWCIVLVIFPNGEWLWPFVIGAILIPAMLLPIAIQLEKRRKQVQSDQTGR